MDNKKRIIEKPTANNVKCWDSGGSTEMVTQRLKEMFVEMGQKTRIENGQHPAERAVFRKQHGITYGQFVCTVRPEKKEPNRTRFVIGGDKINYPGKVATPTADMLVAKLLFNSVVSTKDAKFMTLDISDFYLMTPLLRPEYIRIKLSDLPEEIIQQYKLNDKANKNGMVFVKITKGMYGLPQSGLLANVLLKKHLNQHGYHQSKLVPGLWKHES